MTAHAKLSASGAHRWLNCLGSVEMESGYQDVSSPYAQEGTHAHALAEKCLVEDVNADKFIGSLLRDERSGSTHIVDAEMAENVQAYLDYVRQLGGEEKHVLVEAKVDFSQYVPEGFGTADHIAISKVDGVWTLYISDLKYGKGHRVEAANNPQGMLYALGAVLDYGFIFEVTRVKIAIVQPRLDHVSEWELSVQELLRWAEGYVKPRAALAAKPGAPVTPSIDACKFCKAKGECKALADYALNVAVEGFEGIADEMETKNAMKMDPDQLAAVLKNVDLIAGWLKSVEATAQQKLEHGENIPGYKLVEGRSLRRWRNEDEARKLLESKIGEDAYEKKLISPSKAEKILKKEKTLLTEYVVKPAGRPTIAPQNDKRKAIHVNACEGFDEVA